ncbi:diguanylate cyclase [Bradyrhizobium sp.]|uniref:sensor domain-containing diguanylate cyclase n=1 Tax=Bradyrhizobium sp. TaxID=376 RepID=UPI002616BB2B|nr:diguanylate cyclase [Bradyrhizobium sp.]
MSPAMDVAQAYAARLMQHLAVPTFVLNPKRQVVIWNRACERLTGVMAAEVLGTNLHWRAFYETKRYCLADLVALGRPDKLAQLYSQHAIADGVGFSAENWCVMPKLGNQLYLAIDASPVHDEEGKLIAIVETLRDMTDQKRAEATLKTLASSDGLTGLANRRSFDQALVTEWARAERTKKPLSLLLADVDHFKLYNDLHGHQQGDECLRAVAAIIGETAFRPADLSARYGGEEFAIIMPETDHKGACKVAERLRAVLAKLQLKHGAVGAGPSVTLSIGIATRVPDETVSADWLLMQADEALYAAKHSGRNRIVCAENILATLAHAGAERGYRAAGIGESRRANRR